MCYLFSASLRMQTSHTVCFEWGSLSLSLHFFPVCTYTQHLGVEVRVSLHVSTSLPYMCIYIQHHGVQVRESLPVCLSLPDVCLCLPVEERHPPLKTDSAESRAVWHLVAESAAPTAQMSHGTCISESCRAYESVVLCIWRSHVAHTNEGCDADYGRYTRLCLHKVHTHAYVYMLQSPMKGSYKE